MMPLRKLEAILRYKDEEVFIKECSNGIMVLSNKKLVRCTGHYYCNPDKKGQAPKMSATNRYLNCERIRNYLGIADEVGSQNCQHCHLLCLKQLKKGKLSFKK